MISEVQISCIVLMGLVTLFLFLFLPRYTVADRVLDFSRKLLAGGTAVVTLHFILQNILHKQFTDVSDIRTIFNMIFGIPISYMVNMSYFYLQRNGEVTKKEWWFSPIAFILSLIVLLFYLLGGKKFMSIDVVLYTLAVLYSLVLNFNCFLQLREYFRIVKKIKMERDLSFLPLVKWTKWSMFVLTLIGLGFPFMTFNMNLMMRSLYGVLAISAAFLYILCFIGYSFNYYTNSNLSNPPVDEGKRNAEQQQLSELKMQRMNEIVEKFIASGYYLQVGITMKDVAIEMGISCNMLKVWLRTTEYGRFNAWLVHLRIEKAKEMLLDYPDLNSEEIAEKCGFCDRQYFQHLFTKQEGISPSKWVKEHKFTR